MIKIRPSSLGLIMTEPKVKTEVLSKGAKTYIKSLAREFVYGFNERVTSKYMLKGIDVEDQSIQLYNNVFGTNYIKNTVRKESEILTGECDIDTGSMIIDIKSSWSLGTFPALEEDAISSDYEWQVRAYMMLWNREFGQVAYCMVTTPEELMKYEQMDMHIVDSIDESLRVTVVNYQRDASKEELITIKCKAAQNYFNEIVEKIATDHNHRKVKQ